MTLDNFHRLCYDQWMQPGQGDVVELRLNGPSAAQLAMDIITRKGPENNWFLQHISRDDLAAIAAGDTIRKVANPVTKSAVTITVGTENSADAVLVHYGPHAEDQLILL
jgi:hypothetical protein